MIFIIPCKYDKNKPLVYDCIKSIRTYHSDKIVIVDSNSENKDYFELKDKYVDIIIEDIKNDNYIEGAIWHVYNKYVDDTYCVLHDSASITQNLDEFKKNDVTSIGYFTDSWCDPEDTRVPWAEEQFKKTDFEFMFDGWFGVWGSMFLAQRHVLDEIHKKGGNLILPTNKRELEAMERIWGIFFQQLDYNIVQNSMNGYVEHPSREIIKKVHPMRQ